MNDSVEQGVHCSISVPVWMVLLAGGLEKSQALEGEVLQVVRPVCPAPTK